MTLIVWVVGGTVLGKVENTESGTAVWQREKQDGDCFR